MLALSLPVSENYQTYKLATLGNCSQIGKKLMGRNQKKIESLKASLFVSPKYLQPCYICVPVEFVKMLFPKIDSKSSALYFGIIHYHVLKMIILNGSPFSYILYLLDCTVFKDSLPVLVVFAIKFLTVNRFSLT